MFCSCGSGKLFANCCGPFLAGKAFAATAEQLMRSRYTAYTKADIAYIIKTQDAERFADFDVNSAKAWAQHSLWKGLKVLKVVKGSENDNMGVVEFEARYEENGERMAIHEVSHFARNEHGQWIYIDFE